MTAAATMATRETVCMNGNGQLAPTYGQGHSFDASRECLINLWF